MNQDQLLKELDELRAKVAELESIQLEIAESQSRYEAIVGAFDGLVYICSADYKIEFMNSRLIERTGRNAVGEDCYRALHDLDEICPWCVNERVFAGETVRWEVQSPKDQRWYHIVNTPIGHPDGSVSKMAMIRDISERKLGEIALRERENRFRQLFESASDLIYRTDPNGRFTFVNPIAIDLTGYSKDELIGRDYLEIVPPEWRKEVARFYRIQFLKKLANTYYELPLLCKGGERIWVGQHVQLVLENDKPVGYQAIARDITDRKLAEQALRDSEEKYRTLVEESFDGIFVQKSTEIVFANSRLCEMLGYSEPELVGKEHWRIYHPDYYEVTRIRAQARMRGESVPSRYEVRLQRKDGTSFDGEINAKALTIEGQPGIQVWIRDVTERKKAEESLRKSEELYRELFDNSADLIYTHDLEGNYTSVNKAVESLLGYTPEEFLKISYREIVDPDYLRITEDNLRRKVNGHVDRTGPYEVLVTTKDGQRLWLEVNSRIIIHEGRRVGIHGMARDISDRKVAQEQLKRLFAAVEQAGETIVVTDPLGTIEYVNPAFEATTGYTYAEAIGKNLSILKSGIHGRAFYEEMWDTISGGAVWRGRLTNRRKDGTLYEETATISPIKDETGRIVNYVAVKRDVTREVMLQRQLLQAQKMEAIGTLAGGIAHDFNNVLQAILGYSDLLLMKTQPQDPDRKKLEVIQHAARDGADLVSRILTFSRKGESEIRPMDLNIEILRVEKLLLRTLPRMIQIDVLLAEDLQIIDADPAQIEQVILNLGVNAQHAMPDGGRLVIETSNVSLNDEYLRTHLGAQPGKYVLLTISDTGVGIEADVLDRIFEPFFTTKSNRGGTGLGLAMVHGIVAQHGGYIRCYSEPGRGTSFKIYFPVSAGELIPDVSSTREMPAFGTETILLVDDDDQIREMARQMVELGGYQVITARSGEEALEMYTSHGADIALIILDLIMPGMGGNRCLEELLRIDPDVRVLVASGYSENGLSVAEKGAGARGFVGKPYDAKDILSAIRKVLDKGHL